MAYIVYIIRVLVRALGYPLRRLRRPPDYVLFTLEGAYPDIPLPKQGFLQRRLTPKRMSLMELGRQFDRVARDSRVRGVVLHLVGPKLSIAQQQTVRGFIRRLRESGKRVVAWSSGYDMGGYYIAAAADEVLLAPGGTVGPLGLAHGYVFLADALSRVGLEADFVQISPYKTAADMLTRSEMSAEARKMAEWLIEDTYSTIVADVSRDRDLVPDRVRALIDGAPYTDEEALAAGAVDGIMNQEELPARLAEAGRPARIAPFSACRRKLPPEPLARPGGYLALIRIEGMIVDGHSSRPPTPTPRIPLLLEPRTGDLTVVQQVRRVLRDKRAKALVLFIDSEGGSSTASEAMVAALRQLTGRKPVVVCMSSIAASGGYYVATPAVHIVAQPGTLTGSIGVLAGKLVSARLLERLLINREVIQRGEHATFFGMERPFTAEERAQMVTLINRVYDLFLDRVSDGRGMSKEEIDAIGGGRVWTGKQALAHGLVDALGGLDAALAKARELGGLSPRSPVREIPVPKRDNAPIPSTAALLSYAAVGMEPFRTGKALCLSPLLEVNDVVI